MCETCVGGTSTAHVAAIKSQICSKRTSPLCASPRIVCIDCLMFAALRKHYCSVINPFWCIVLFENKFASRGVYKRNIHIKCEHVFDDAVLYSHNAFENIIYIEIKYCASFIYTHTCIFRTRLFEN